MDAAEDVDQDSLDARVGGDDLEGRRDLVHLRDGGEMVWGDGVGRWRGEMARRA